MVFCSTSAGRFLPLLGEGIVLLLEDQSLMPSMSGVKGRGCLSCETMQTLQERNVEARCFKAKLDVLSAVDGSPQLNDCLRHSYDEGASRASTIVDEPDGPPLAHLAFRSLLQKPANAIHRNRCKSTTLLLHSIPV